MTFNLEEEKRECPTPRGKTLTWIGKPELKRLVTEMNINLEGRDLTQDSRSSTVMTRKARIEWWCVRVCNPVTEYPTIRSGLEG